MNKSKKQATEVEGKIHVKDGDVIHFNYVKLTYSLKNIMPDLW